MALGAGDADGRKIASEETERDLPISTLPTSPAEWPARPSSTVSVFDGQRHAGDIVERDGTFDAYVATGRNIGAFKHQREACRAIPAGSAS
jgi:hypothetical protein